MLGRMLSANALKLGPVFDILWFPDNILWFPRAVSQSSSPVPLEKQQPALVEMQQLARIGVTLTSMLENCGVSSVDWFLPLVPLV